MNIRARLIRLWQCYGWVTFNDLVKLEQRMNEQIKAFSDAVQASFGKVATAVDGLTGDIQILKKKIEDLQNSPGTLTPEDQAALDAIQTQANTIADKLAALDAATENVPTPPTT